MKILTQNLILPLIVFIIGGVFLYYFQLEKADLRYVLSHRIPTSFSDDLSSENIQLLEIKNVGKSEANGILIKSNKSIIKFEIQKNSLFDQVETPKNDGPFEVRYSSLPPSGAFKIILKSASEGLAESDLTITHSKGKASDVFSNSKRWIIFIFWGFLAATITFMLLGMRDFFSQRWESKLDHNINEILKIEKPFYINNIKWNKIKTEAWDWSLKKDLTTHYLTPEKSSSFAILTSENIYNIEDSRWVEIQEKAIDVFLILMRSNLNSAFNLKEILFVQKIKKPKYLPDKKWERLMEDIEKIFRRLITDDLKFYTEGQLYELASNKKCSFELNSHFQEVYFEILTESYSREIDKNLFFSADPSEYLDVNKVSILNKTSMKKVIDRAYDRHYEKVVSKILYKHDSLNVLDSENISIFKESDQNTIGELAYRKELYRFISVFDVRSATEFLSSKLPNWLKEDDAQKLSRIAKNIVDVDFLMKKTKIHNDILKNITYYLNIGEERPELLNEDEWVGLKNIEKEIVYARRSINVLNRRSKITNIRNETLKNKLRKQFNFINEILKDPSAIDRVETYEDLFSTGNFGNLKKLAHTLSRL